MVPGRDFLRRLLDLCRGLRKPHHRVKLTVGVKDDLKVWEQFLIFFNGKCFFMEDNVVSTDMLQLYTYASGKYGYGALLETSWFYAEWNESWENVDITIKELYPIALAVDLWGERFSNKYVCFNCDNETLIFILNKQTSKDSCLMLLVRKLVLLALKFNILFSAKHLPDKVNIYSDALSRLQVSKFQTLMPQADLQPTRIPPLPELPA